MTRQIRTVALSVTFTLALAATVGLGSCHDRNAAVPVKEPRAPEPVASRAPEPNASVPSAVEPAPPEPCKVGAWCRLPTPLPEPKEFEDYFTSVWCSARDDIWIGGSGRAFHYDGARFREARMPFEVDVKALWGTGPSSVYAATNSRSRTSRQGHVLHFDGKSWEKMDLPAVADAESFTFADIWGSSDQNVYVAGDLLFRFDGKRWISVSLPEFTRMGEAVLGGSGPRDVYILFGYSLAHFGGVRWKHLKTSPLTDLFSSVNLTDIWSGGKNDVLLVGYHDVENEEPPQHYLHFDGRKWNEHETGHVDRFNAVAGRDKDHLYAVGRRIYRYSKPGWVIDTHPGAPEEDRLMGYRDITACGDCVVVLGGQNQVLQLCE
jgi:hypothetical protein